MTSSKPPRKHAGPPEIVAAGDDATARAVALLRAGEIVALPTETVYGLAANAADPEAVAKIFEAKGRPQFNPLIVHVPDMKAAWQIAKFDERSERLARAFWPGPLTMVLPLVPDAPVAKAVTAGLPTIALRCPAHPVMRQILQASELCLAAPSANRSGSVSPTHTSHVAESLDGAVSLIVDGGPCSTGLESTIVALRPNGWQILRPGPISEEQIAAMLGVAPLPVVDARVEAPGMLASHYAPQKPVRLNVREAQPNEWLIGFGAIAGDDSLSASGDLIEAAATLYAALHRGDASGLDRIAVAPIPNHGLGIAINDRLKRASA